MEYKTEILIKKPIAEVMEKMQSVSNMKHWQPGFEGMGHISGTPGKTLSKSVLKYSYGKQQMEITETVTKQNFPDEFHATYASKGIINIQENSFLSTSEGFTKWVSHNDFKATNFSMSAMLFLMPSTFKKQVKSYMINFKNFVEHGTSVANA